MKIKLKIEHKKVLKSFILLAIPQSLYSSQGTLIALDSDVAGIASTLLARKKPLRVPEDWEWISRKENSQFLELIKQSEGKEKCMIEIYYFTMLSTIKIFDYYLKYRE